MNEFLLGALIGATISIPFLLIAVEHRLDEILKEIKKVDNHD